MNFSEIAFIVFLIINFILFFMIFNTFSKLFDIIKLQGKEIEDIRQEMENCKINLNEHNKN